MADENVFKVKLVNQMSSREHVVFNVTPDVVETRNVNYRSLEPVHQPGQIYVYGGTSSRTFNLSNVKLVSRNVEEATENLRNLQLLRSWTMPRFGEGSTTLSNAQRGNQRTFGRQEIDLGETLTFDNQDRTALFGQQQLGAPPQVLYFSAYSNTPLGSTTSQNTKASNQQEHIRRVPIVIQQLSIPYPSDVDYIPAENGTPMPTLMTIDMVLLETHSPGEYNRFNLSKFKNGILEGF